MRKFHKLLLLAIVFCLVGAPSTAVGDWEVGDPYKMHYPQMPDPEGWDICLNCQYIADDFGCTETGVITDIHIWVSWRYEEVDWDNIRNWEISIWSDALGGPGSCGWQPGQRLWTLAPGDGNFQISAPLGGPPAWEGWHCPSGMETLRDNHEFYYQVNITGITKAFEQEQGHFYWLVINAPVLPPAPPPVVGWKTTVNPYQCEALWSLAPDIGALGTWLSRSPSFLWIWPL